MRALGEARKSVYEILGSEKKTLTGPYGSMTNRSKSSATSIVSRQRFIHEE